MSTSKIEPNVGGEEATKGEPPSEPPPPITVEPIPAPKKWPKCWLSVRLSAMNAQRIAGFGGNTQLPPLYSAAQGRQGFRGILKNPTAEGNCVLNWFGQDHSQEPWVLQLQEQYPDMHATLTCTADATPQCTCISILPTPPYGNSLSLRIGQCVRDAATGGHELYNHKDPDSSHTVPDTGRCATVNNIVTDVSQTRLNDSSFLQETTDKDSTPTTNISCRTDFEPFAPQPDEKDWYADKIRDWAITTCTDQTTNCRCYLTYNKSGHEEGKRSSGFEYNTCLLCENGTCQQVLLQ